ncbi:MAG TPA: hypothetical protein VLU92_08885 [Candidatus Dormibacteraeota bacterium]|nr:hypothetical protein [Candidatus Dormibacteraeota bacterium]
MAVTAAYGVLVGQQNGATYTVSLIGIDGKVVASAQASTPAAVTCANAAAGVVAPPVSTSNSRLYFMDGQGVVRFLSPNGDTGRATSVPIGAARRSMFTVSPDDRRIAVVVDDFNSTGAATRLYVEELNGGGNHVDLFSESGAYTLWPIGWHGVNNLVVAKVPACTQGGGPGCCGPQELHVIDPATAVRRFTIGGAACVVAGAPSPAGAVCDSSTQGNVLTWTATTTSSFPLQSYTPAYLSPDGKLVAIASYTAPTVLYPSNVAVSLEACGWIDDTHLMSGGDVQHQPSVGNITTGQVVPVAAQGDCGGRIPGGL